jgi:hypothetical protein
MELYFRYIYFGKKIGMNRLGWILLVLLSASPAWCAKKITVQQLKNTLTSMHQARKSDADVATALQQVVLSEELTQPSMHELESLLPGPQAQSQLRCLAVQSAVLTPPAEELPAVPAPDLTTQKAILAKAVDYVTKAYMHNPRLIASKTTTIYGEAVRGVTFADLSLTNSLRDLPMQMGELVTHTTEVESENGIEKAQPAPVGKAASTRLVMPQSTAGPVLSFILAQAAEAGSLAWLRWESIQGKPAAVFSFAVDKAKSRYEVNYCCFPLFNTRKIGQSDMYFDVASGAFKATVPYRGRFYIDPDTGTVLRLITQAELPAAAPVHSEDMRIDYGSISVGGRSLIVPLATETLAALVPGGENDVSQYKEVHRYTAADYGGYRLAANDKTETPR